MSTAPSPLYRQLVQADACAARCRRLEAALRLLTDKAMPVPSVEPDEGDVGYAAYLNASEWRLVMAALEEITLPQPENRV